MNNNNNITINNLNKTNFSYDNSEEQLQVGVKIILNAFENKIAFFEKEISNLKETSRIKDERIGELESILENVSEDLKKCQEFNTNLIEENKYLVDFTEKLNDDNSKLAKFKNSILSSLQLDNNFILNQDHNNLNLNLSANLNNNNHNNNQLINQNNDEYEKSGSNPNLINSQNSGNSNNNVMHNFFPNNKNLISFNGKDHDNNNNAFAHNQSSRNIHPKANMNPNINSNFNLNNFNSFNSGGVNLNTISNMNSMLSPLNYNDKYNESFNPNFIDSGSHIHDMIKNLQNKMRVNSKINKNVFNNQGIERKSNSNNYNNQTLNNRNNNDDHKDCLSDVSSNLIVNDRTNNISEKISELKNKFKSQKYEKFNTADTLTSLNTQNSDGNSKKGNIENAINLAKDKSGKSNKYQQSIKFFNEARVILKKEEFDELVFLIKSINQGKVSSEEFNAKINLIIGNHPSLNRDLPNVISVPA